MPVTVERIENKGGHKIQTGNIKFIFHFPIDGATDIEVILTKGMWFNFARQRKWAIYNNYLRLFNNPAHNVLLK